MAPGKWAGVVKENGWRHFLIHLAISTVGSIVTALVLVSIMAVIMAAVTSNPTGANFVDRVIEQPSFRLFNQPFYVGPLLVAVVLGMVLRRRFASPIAKWVWAVPFACLVVSIMTWKTGGNKPFWQDVFDNFFGAQCQNSECAYEALVTLPFYTSVAYAIGWLITPMSWRKASS